MAYRSGQVIHIMNRILRMGDPRLRRPGAAVELLDTPELHAAVAIT
jgi:hypothetical protein